MKHNKFRALVTLDPASFEADDIAPLSQPCRLVIRACHHDTHCGKVFAAVVAPDDDVPRRPGDRRTVVTLLVDGDDATDYLDAGDHFDLWLGGTVGHGIVSQRVIPCW